MNIFKLVLLSVFLLFFKQIHSQNHVLPLWTDKVPNHKSSDQIEKRDTNGIIRISNVQKPDISVFLPSKSNSTGQAVIICPGGGYQILAYDWEGTDIAKWLNSLGIAGIVLKYRLPNPNSNIIPYKSPLLDAQRAIRLTRFYAKKWNIDPDKIGIMGFSAGGHLASTAGTHFDMGDKNAIDPVDRLSSRPDFMMLGYPVISFNDSITHQGSKSNLLDDYFSPELEKEFSNELQVTEKTPPTFLFHAADDKAVSPLNSIVFYNELIKNNVASELLILPEGGHGFSLAIGKPYINIWTKNCESWLKYINQ